MIWNHVDDSMNYRVLWCWTVALGSALLFHYPVGGEVPPATEDRAVSSAPGFSIQTQDGKAWLVRPDGRKFFSLGVCCVDMGTPTNKFTPTNPSYAAWQHYSTSNQWAKTTLKRLKSWGFSTVGAWSDFQTLKRCPDKNVVITPVLHIGSTAGAPWWDMWDRKIISRMEQVARDQILAIRDDPRLLGYYSDNKMGWWNAALLKMTLEQAPDSGQRKRLLALLREIYRNDWTRLLEDFEPEGAESWAALESGGLLYLKPGGNGLQTVQHSWR